MVIVGPNGSRSDCPITLVQSGVVIRSPLIVADGVTADPEPDPQCAGVTQTQPHVIGGGACFHEQDLHPLLHLLRIHRHQVHVPFSAVSQSFRPRLILSNQNQIIWNKQINKKIKILNMEPLKTRSMAILVLGI